MSVCECVGLSSRVGIGDRGGFGGRGCVNREDGGKLCGWVWRRGEFVGGRRRVVV